MRENERAVRRPKAGKVITLANRRARSGRLFCLPFIIGFLLFFAQPFVMAVWYSFCKLELTSKGFTSAFVGLTNYRFAFVQDPDFLKMLMESIGNITQQLLVILLLSLFIAVILNQKFRGRMAARAIFFLPVIISSGIVIFILKSDVFSDSMRMGTAQSSFMFQGMGLEEILRTMNLPATAVDTFMSVVNSIFDTLWRSGVQVLLFLAGLQGISDQLYEAAKVEGATAWESFWKITLPMVSPVFLLNITYTIVDTFTDYNSTIMRTIQDLAFSQWRYAYSCALALLFFATVAVLLLLANLIVSRFVFYYND